ncbi:glycosyltransferase [Turicibacter sanguinis]|uniref:glycosyltransferase n=1 Tax=Turicibacter sanguinis TaxID=154288 RepID=UPI0018AB3573|nr:glycosyltransferase [Turicibacter sanguinis]MDB8567891.1 glycosyltransferase [Turicibacter sanguinis]MDB8570640.1 glycosyltransferase [Turicibacter sanguinis]MDB8573393.1 glycosyltransferase [Turicibacter sanguinis]MDB8582153.1 glycosyltransferase [Turicibacter sanguinis]
MGKILIINLGKHYGGAEKLIESLTDIEDTLLALNKDNEFSQLMLKNKKKVLLCSTQKKDLVKTVISLYRYIKKYEIDIIHCHGIPSNIVGYLLKKIVNVKVITTIHSDLDYDFSGLKRIIYMKIEKYLIPKFDSVIVVSEDLNKKVSSRNKNNKTKIIYNGVEHGIYEKSVLPTFQNKLTTFLMVGRLTKVKNHKLLLKVCKEIKMDNYKVVIIGEGEERKNIEQFIKENKLEKHIELLGFKDNVSEYMTKCDALILTSIMEGIPLVILEAFSQKLPVISSNVGGIGEIITNEENGLLFASNDYIQLKNIMEKIINKEIDMEKISNKALEDFNMKWSKNIMLNRYKEEYNLLRK